MTRKYCEILGKAYDIIFKSVKLYDRFESDDNKANKNMIIGGFIQANESFAEKFI